MNIEIHQPELESIIQQRMATGRFRDVEDVLLQALRSGEPADKTPQPPTLADIFARARVQLDGEELDLARDPSLGRPVDLS